MTATAPRRAVPTRTASTGSPDSPDWVEPLARFGLVGKGILHAVIGLLALEIALNRSSSSEASTSGALQWIADRPFGVAALWAVGLSLLALAVWQGITAVTGDPVEESDAKHRAAWAFKALFYGSLALASLRGALDGGSSGSSGSGGDGASSATDTVFDWPMGRWIVVAAGLAVIGLGVHLIVKHAVHAEFAQRLRVSEDSTPVLLGRVGYGLRSLAYLLVGFFLAQAGLAGEEDRKQGLAGALERVADESWGTALLLAMAVGFLAYGAYCVVESRLRRDA
ncbi:MAG TPA: DUF1206 domain-containing protein [Acidimicrobiales bacterium]|nr:DUF1206 domain-containing protein [Acidimicrobiales bacterium]